MLDERLSCTLCRGSIMCNARYCCDPKKYVCLSCSHIRCGKCNKTRMTILESNAIGHNPSVFSAKIEKRNRCCNCRQEQVLGKREFFYEENCKMYYCHTCILVFYEKYCTMINRLEKQFGSKPQMQVELRCGCEIQTKKIIDFVQRYCYDCSTNIDGPFTILKNECRIMKRCLDHLKASAQRVSYNRAQQQKAKQDWCQIKMLLVSCQNCKEILDGDKAEIGEEVGDIYLCKRCLKLSKQYEQLYAKKSQAKAEKPPKQQSKPKKRQQSMEKSVKVQPNNERKPPLKCEICHVGIPRLILNQIICRFCFDAIDSGNNVQIVDEHSQKSKIKPVNDRQLVKDRQEVEQKSASNKSLFKEKSQQPQQRPNLIQNNGNKVEEPKLPEIKNRLQSKIEVKLDQSFLRNLRESQLDDRIEVQKQCPIPIPKEGSNSKIHPEFYPPSTITLAINLPPSDAVSCSECSYQIPSKNCYRVYRRDPNIQSTSRIAETEEQLLKYQKENMIKIFCKGCYLRLRQRMKETEKRRAMQRSQVGGRYGYSAAKREPKKEAIAQNTAERFRKNDDYGVDSLPKRFIDLKASAIDSPLKKVPAASKEINSPSYQCKICRKMKRFQDFIMIQTTCKECEADKRMTGSLRDKGSDYVQLTVYCKLCRRMVKDYEMNKVKNYCKDCQMKLIEADLKKKKEDDFKKVKCIRCHKMFSTTQKQGKPVRYCTSCMTGGIGRN